MWRLDPNQFLLALSLDLIFGDPRGWPHLARCAGWLASRFEFLLVLKFKRSIFLGLIFWILVNGTLIAAYFGIYYLCLGLSALLAWLWQVFVVYQSIAATDLSRHAVAVFTPLSANNFPLAREKLSWLVGRDTANLDATEISRGVIEGVAESLNDAIVAPLFWCLLAGAPGALLYRTANTLDSMVGHRTETYEKFGKIPARIDDVLNFIPARFTALIFWLLRSDLSWIALHRDASRHASPNAGWGEAAMAYALNVRLGGENFYQGQRIDGCHFNQLARRPNSSDIQSSLTWMWRTAALASLTFFLLDLFRP